MRRVLVVDDHAMTVELLTDRLEAMGLDVLSASSGPEALRLVATARPDLILLDVMMPDMDGFEVTRRLKGDPKTRGIGVVLLTALSAAEDEASARAAGADAYLRKPFQRHELREVISTMLGE